MILYREVLTILFALALLILVCVIFVRISRKVRRGGSGGLSITMMGSLYDLHGKDGRRAIETIADVKAGRKMEEQKSSDDLDPNEGKTEIN
jgi:hypothetical protein